jgi:hypothetical protein
MRISGFDLTIDVPNGWQGRVYKRPVVGDDTTMPVLQASNLALAADDDDLAPATRQRLGPLDVVVVLLEQEPPRLREGEAEYPTITEAVSISAGDAVRIQSVPPEHAAFLRRFRSDERFFTLIVVFGSDPPPSETFAVVAEALQSLRVDHVSAEASSVAASR